VRAITLGFDRSAWCYCLGAGIFHFAHVIGRRNRRVSRRPARAIPVRPDSRAKTSVAEVAEILDSLEDKWRGLEMPAGDGLRDGAVVTEPRMSSALLPALTAQCWSLVPEVLANSNTGRSISNAVGVDERLGGSEARQRLYCMAGNLCNIRI
jgi:hypothetical protein